jgi:Cu/Zn superoxide dismutase
MRSMCIGMLPVAVIMLLSAGCERTEAPREEARPGQTPATEQRTGEAPIRPTPPGAAPAVGDKGATAPAGVKEEVEELELEVVALDKSEIEAEAKLTPAPDGVNVVLEVDDAPPGALRVVIHEKGDCSNAAAASFGEPMMTSAKAPSAGEIKPAGDLGTIQADKDGNGKLERKLEGVKLETGDPTSLMGRSIVIHEGDKGGRTSKDFGKALACARITRG